MGGPISLNFFNGGRIDIKLEQLVKIHTGGQGILYRFTADGKNYALKAMPEEESIFRRLKEMRENILQAGAKVPKSVTFRSLPIGQGSVAGPVFSLTTIDQLYLLVFNWIDGKILPEALKNIPPMNSKRRQITAKVLDLLVFLHNNSIIHSDLFPDNFLLNQNEEVFLIDLEGAGIQRGNKWLWHPLTIGKPYWFPTPPRLRTADKFLDRWVGLFLIFWLLFGFNPFPFLTRIDLPVIQLLAQTTDKDLIKWPPRIINATKIRRFLDPLCSLQLFEDFLNQYKLDKFQRVLFSTYILGIDQPSKRVDFNQIKKSLKEILT